MSDDEAVAARKRAKAREHAHRKAPERRAAEMHWYATHPLARIAHLRVARAIAKGRLIRPKQCDRCRRPCRPDAHHEDYARPLEVGWLCRSCHLKERQEQTGIRFDDNHLRVARASYAGESWVPAADAVALASECLRRGDEVVRRGTDLAALSERVAQLETALREDHDLLEAAWRVIANAGGGDWTRETVEWRDAAACWRGQWHKWLDDRAALAAGKPASET